MSSPSNEPRPNEIRRVVSAEQARQGVTGRNVRYMLGFGLAAALVVLGAIWLAYFA
jgi:hypothetical protein